MVEHIRRAFRMIQRSPHLIAVHREKIIAFITIFAIVGSAFRFVEYSDALSYTFTQSSWAGGYSASVPTHTANRSGWTNFASNSNIATSTSLSLALTAATKKLTTISDFSMAGVATSTLRVVSETGTAVTNDGMLRLEAAEDTLSLSDIYNPVLEGATQVNDVVKLALDDAGNPYTVIRNHITASTQTLYFTRRQTPASAVWVDPPLALVTSNIFSHAFAIDGVGGKHVVYYDATANYIKELYCAPTNTCDSSFHWSGPTNVAPVTGGEAQMDMEKDPSGNLHLFFDDSAGGSRGIWYKKCTADTTAPYTGCTWSSAPGSSASFSYSAFANSARTVDVKYYSYGGASFPIAAVTFNGTGSRLYYFYPNTTAVLASFLVASDATRDNLNNYINPGADNSSLGFATYNNNLYFSFFSSNNYNLYVTRCLIGGSCSTPQALSQGVQGKADGRYSELFVAGTSEMTVVYERQNPTTAVYRRTCQISAYASLPCAASTNWSTPVSYIAKEPDDGIQAKISTFDEPHIAFRSRDGDTAFYAHDYAPQGTYTSGAFELQQNAVFYLQSVAWQHATPTGTSVTVRAKTGATASISDIGSCPSLTSGGSVSANPCIVAGHKYIKFEVMLASSSKVSTPLFKDITFTYNYMPETGIVESSVFNTENAKALMASEALQWKERLNGGKVQFQIRTNTSANMSGISYVGPNNDPNAYFESPLSSCTEVGSNPVTVTCSVPSQMYDSTYNEQYFQYKVLLKPGGSTSPEVTEVSVTYVINEKPVPTITNTPSMNGSGAMSVAYNIYDIDNSSSEIYLMYHIGASLASAISSSDTVNIRLAGSNTNLIPSAGTILIDSELISYSGINAGTLQNVVRGANQSTAASHSVNALIFARATTATGDVGTVSCAQGSTCTKSISWTPSADVSGAHYASGRVRVVSNDKEKANPVGYSESSNIMIDTNPPTWSANPSIALSANTVLKSTASYKTSSRTHSMTYTVSDPSSPMVAYAYGVGGTKGSGFDGTSGLITGTAYSASPSSPASVTLPAAAAVYDIYTFVKDAYGNSSNKSISVLYDPDAPSAPQSLQAIEVSNAGEIEFYLNWAALSPAPEDASGSGDFKEYRIYRCTGGAAVCSNAPGDTDFESVGTTAAIDINSISSKITCSNCIGSEYFYKVTAVDDIGNESVPSNVISVTVTGTTVDVSAPTIQGTPSAGTAGVNYIPITWTASETAYSQVAYDGIGTTDFTTSPTITNNSSIAASAQHLVNMVGLAPAQSYAYEVRAIDGSNNIGRLAAPTQTFTFPSIDTSQPTVAAQITPLVYAKTAQFDIVANEPVIALVSYDGKKYGSYQFTTNHSIVLPAVLTSGGQTTYSIALRDLQGNETTSCSGCSGTLSLGASDTIRPQFSSSTPITATPDAFTANISWSTDEKTSGFVEIGTALDAGGAPLYTRTFGTRALSTAHTVAVSGLTPGTLHYYRVRSSDGAGNERISGQLNFTTDDSAGSDVTAPTISGVTFDANKGSVLVRWTTNEPATAQVAVSTAQGFTTVATTSDARLRTNHTVELPGLSDATFYYMRVEARDGAGNITIDDNGGSFYKFGTLKNTNSDIVISGVNVNVNESQTTVTWTTNEDTTGYVEYGFDRSFGEVYGNETMTRNHSVILPPDILGKVTYTFRVRVRNAQGDEAVSENVAIFVAPSTKGTELADDSTAPTVSSVATPIITSNSAVITWSTNEPALTQLEYGVNSSYGYLLNATTTSYNTTHSIVISDLDPKSTYVFKIIATDEAGNVGVKDKDNSNQLLSFTTAEDIVGDTNQPQPDPGDKEAPIISNITIHDIKSKSAKVSWDTNEDSASLVEYGTSPGVRSSTAGSASNFLRNHDIEITGLKSGTKYYVAAIGLDYSGNRSISEELNFTTTASTTEEEALTELEEQLLEEANKQQLELLESFNTLSSTTQALLQDFLAGIKTVSDEERAKALKVLFGELAGPPRILGSKPNVTVTDTTAIIEWETLTETNSIVSYASDAEFEDDKDSPYTKEAGKKSEFVTIHKVTLTELKPFTTYNFQISGEEKGGTKTIGVNRTFKTLPIQPKFESFKIGDISEYSVRVSWKTNIPTKGVITIQDRATGEGRTIEANDLKLEHEYVVKELKSETKYALFVVAQSEEGETVRTDPRNFQTSPDSVPPEITSVRTKLTLSTGREDNVQAVITWSTDESSTSQVEYIEGARLEGSNLQKSPTLSDLTSSHVVVITRLRPATIYTFRVVSTDAAGNRGESRQFKIFTPRKEESVLELIIKNFEDAFGFLKELQ